MKNQFRFRLVSDDDGHSYVIPADRLKDWHAWVGSDSYGNGDLPAYAVEIGGSPEALLTFAEPHISGKSVRP